MTPIHPRGGSDPGLSALLAGGRRSLDLTAGYPVHRVETIRRWTNPHGVRFTDWTATCGHTQTDAHPAGPRRGGYHDALPAELCRSCWPTLARQRRRRR